MSEVVEKKCRESTGFSGSRANPGISRIQMSDLGSHDEKRPRGRRFSIERKGEGESKTEGRLPTKGRPVGMQIGGPHAGTSVEIG